MKGKRKGREGKGKKKGRRKEEIGKERKGTEEGSSARGGCDTRYHHFAAQRKLLLKNLNVVLLRIRDYPLVFGVARLKVQPSAVNIRADDARVQAGAAELCSEDHHVEGVRAVTKIAGVSRARALCVVLVLLADVLGIVHDE
jgi:hypothetical protein